MGSKGQIVWGERAEHLFALAREGSAGELAGYIEELAAPFAYHCASEERQGKQRKVPEEWGRALDFAFCCAAAAGRVDTASVLLAAGANVNACVPMTYVDRYGFKTQAIVPILHYIISRIKHFDIFDICKLLCEKDTDLQARNGEGHTPLIGAIIEKQERVCELLVGEGAELNLRDRDGLCALAYAITTSQPDLCRLLLENGADPQSRTPVGIFSSRATQTLLDLAGDSLRAAEVAVSRGRVREPLGAHEQEMSIKRAREVVDILRPYFSDDGQEVVRRDRSGLSPYETLKAGSYKIVAVR